MNAYHVFDKEEQKGPFTLSQLRSMWDHGLLTASAQYFDERQQEWKPVIDLISEQNAVATHPAPAPAPVVPREPAAAPDIPSHVIAQPQTEIMMRQAYGSLFTASWIILLLICGASLIPFIGWVAWFVAIPLLLVTFVLAIIIISRGGTAKGIAILACTLLVTPTFMVCAQILVSGAAAVAGLGGLAALLDKGKSQPVNDSRTWARQPGPVLRPAPTPGDSATPANSTRVAIVSSTPPALLTSRLDSSTPAASVGTDAIPGGIRTMPAEAVTPAPTPRRLPEKTWDHPHVYIQICDEAQRHVADLIKKQLQTNGDVVADVDDVHDHPSVPNEASEVRYIVSDDTEEAEEIASVVRQFTTGRPVSTTPPVPETPYVSHSRQYEIWLARAFRPQPLTSRLDPARVNAWNAEQIQNAIDEIYARRGTDFPNKRAKTWALKQSWYRPVPGLTPDAAEQSFSSEERADVELLAARRAAMTPGAKHNR